jgi:hypothetical protein
MAPYTYNNFYDPVGSQSSQQPQGYTYSNTNAPTTSAQYSTQAASAYGSNYSQSYANQYGSQAYSASGQQAPSQSTTNTNRPAQDYSARANDTTSQYDNSTWNSTQNYASNTYSQQSNRSQTNTSPLYATHSTASTFGRLSLPNDQQTSSNTFAGTQSYPNTSSNASTQNAPSSAAAQHRTYMTAYTQQQTQPPPRYASPAQAQQAQQTSHRKQSSRNVSQPSPQITSRNVQQQRQQQAQQQRQQSTSVEPSPTTVDPSQVYDFRAEQERKARIDAEKRRKILAEAAARQAEEDARKAEEDAHKAEEARIEAEKARLEAEKAKAKEDARKVEDEAAKKKAAQARKNEQRRKAREEKQKSKTAATALQQMASGAGAGAGASGSGGGGSGTIAAMAAMMGDQSQPPANDEEAEMRAMFKKMREFNARNPDMLAKLWEEERSAHAATASPRQPTQALPATQPTPVAAPPAVPAPAILGYKPFVAQTGPKAPSQPSFRAAPPAVPAPVQQQNTALWPPHKKGALAEAAAKWLALLPQNQSTGRTISREQVLKILDTNPSYVQLCELIEKEGIQFERSALAKELLKAVPDGMKNQTGKSGPPPSRMTAQMNAAATPSQPKKRGRPAKDDPTRIWSHKSQAMPVNNANKVPYQTPSFSLVDAAREVNSMSTAPSYPAMGSLASALTGGAVQPPSNPLHDAPMQVDDDPPAVVEIPEVKQEEPRRPPANKEEAARKRTFNDLVDLTKDDESEDEGPPRKTAFVPSSRPPPGMTMPQQRPSNMFDPRHMTDEEFRRRLNADPRTMAALYQPPRHTAPAQPMTFQITPSQSMPPQPIPPKPKGPSQENLQIDRIRGKMLVEPIMRDRVARKTTYDSRTIARDVLLATGRHPDMRALNAHFNTMQHLLGHHGGMVDNAGNKSDLATIKWDIIDPGEPSDAAKVKNSAKGDETEDASEHADDESEAKIQKPERQSSVTSHTAKEVKPHRRPGRPRLPSDAKPPKRSRPSRPLGAPSVRTSTPRPSTADAASPSPAMSATGKPAVGYSAFNNTTVDENGNVIKKKGRPVGWRKDIHSRQANGLAPATPGSKPISSTSRLRQSTTAASISPNSALKQPHYQVFACGMRSCTAELDNIERLKKHLIKFHGSANDEEVWLCEWKDCKSSGTHVDKNGTAKKGKSGVASFDTMEEWLGHVDKVHLNKLRWKLGDGPRGEGETS